MKHLSVASDVLQWARDWYGAYPRIVWYRTFRWKWDFKTIHSFQLIASDQRSHSSRKGENIPTWIMLKWTKRSATDKCGVGRSKNYGNWADRKKKLLLVKIANYCKFCWLTWCQVKCWFIMNLCGQKSISRPPNFHKHVFEVDTCRGEKSQKKCSCQRKLMLSILDPCVTRVRDNMGLRLWRHPRVLRQTRAPNTFLPSSLFCWN